MAAPLVGESGAFGALTTFTDRADAWSEAEAGVLEAIAAQAAIAIARTRLLEELDRSRSALARRAEAEQALREIAARITAMRDPAEILQQVVELASRLVGGQGAILDILDPESGHLLWAYDDGLRRKFTDEERAKLWISVGVGATGSAVAEDRVVIAGDDLVSQFPPSPESTEFYERTGFRSMIAAPITGDDGPLGVIEVYTVRPGAFDEDDAALIRALAGQAAIAITNARLIEELASSPDRSGADRRGGADAAGDRRSGQRDARPRGDPASRRGGSHPAAAWDRRDDRPAGPGRDEHGVDLPPDRRCIASNAALLEEVDLSPNAGVSGTGSRDSQGRVDRRLPRRRPLRPQPRARRIRPPRRHPVRDRRSRDRARRRARRDHRLLGPARCVRRPGWGGPRRPGRPGLDRHRQCPADRRARAVARGECPARGRRTHAARDRGPRVLHPGSGHGPHRGSSPSRPACSARMAPGSTCGTSASARSAGRTRPATPCPRYPSGAAPAASSRGRPWPAWRSTNNGLS